ncbi:MAG: hypothetical protein JXA38_00430 [Methanosarcinaceae archaeon]|nr:hypothetical protein [Methanosarcinaceae archaeon]
MQNSGIMIKNTATILVLILNVFCYANKPTHIRIIHAKSANKLNNECIPEYNPGFWSNTRGNNCYSYACDTSIQRMEHIPQPGFAHGIILDKWNCETVHNAAVADGLKPIDCDEGCGFSCQHQVALCVDPRESGYHWYRKDRDGTWSHKRGLSSISKLDDTWKDSIIDPRKADRGKYTTFCGCYCVDKKKVKIASEEDLKLPKRKSTDENKEVVVVKLGIYSGRPNPEMKLTNKMALQYADLVKLTVSKEQTHPPPPVKLGEFYGFFVQIPDKKAEELGLPGQAAVLNGVFTDMTHKKLTHWSDEAGIERFLTRLAYELGFGDLLRNMHIVEPK